MLARNFRLTHQQVGITKASGQIYSTPFVSVVISKNTLNADRFAVVTSTKLAKKATVRNRIRRQIFAILTNWKGTGNDVLIFPKLGMLKLTYAEIDSEIHQILSKAVGLAQRPPSLPV